MSKQVEDQQVATLRKRDELSAENGRLRQALAALVAASQAVIDRAVPGRRYGNEPARTAIVAWHALDRLTREIGAAQAALEQEPPGQQAAAGKGEQGP